jgi:HlyD family secretion protein
MAWQKRLYWLVPALLVLAGLIYGFWPRPVSVDTVTVERGPLRQVVEQEGRTRVVERYRVAAPVTGRLRRLSLEAGDRMQQGEPLLRIDPAAPALLDPRRRGRARAGLKQAEAELKAARAEAELAQSELERTRRLVEQDKMARAELDRRRAKARSAEARLEAARYAVEAARYEARRAERLRQADTPDESLTVTAPVNGRILEVHQESRTPVSPGQPIITLGNPGSLEVVTEVLSGDAVAIAPGMPVEYTGWGGDKVLSGEVERVEPAGFEEVSALGVEERRVNVISTLTSPREEWQGLGAGYRVLANFVLWSADDALQVPEGALFRHEGGWAVFRVTAEGTARLQPVEVGRSGKLSRQILHGLQAGDRIITHPPDTLTEGTPVQPEPVGE